MDIGEILKLLRKANRKIPKGTVRWRMNNRVAAILREDCPKYWRKEGDTWIFNFDRFFNERVAKP